MTEEGLTVSVKALKRMDQKKEPITKAMTSVGGPNTTELDLPENDSVMTHALRKAGVTPDELALILKRLLNQKVIKIDSKGKIHEGDDAPTQLKALEACVKLMGLGENSKGGSKHLHLHGKQIDELFGKVGIDPGEGED